MLVQSTVAPTCFDINNVKNFFFLLAVNVLNTSVHPCKIPDKPTYVTHEVNF
jgi:hypothetical protein